MQTVKLYTCDRQ